MNNWPIGLSTGCFYKKNILDCLEIIRSSGFSTVEVCSAPEHLDFHDLSKVREVASRMDDMGMDAYSFHAPFADHIDISTVEGAERDRAVGELFRAIDAAALLQVHYIVVHPGPEHSYQLADAERFRRMENAVGVLNRVVRHCHNAGIRCVLENKLPHLLFGNTSDILWIIDALEGIEGGACLDTGHGFLSGDIWNLLYKLNGHLKMVHAHDNRGRFDDHLPPGDGLLDWERLCRDLTRLNFRGGVILEMAGTDDPAITMANARRGRVFLRKLMRRLAIAEA